MELVEVAIANQVFVYRTNVTDEPRAEMIASHLKAIVGISEVSIDLEDWEKVLRIVGDATVQPQFLMDQLILLGVRISEID